MLTSVRCMVALGALAVFGFAPLVIRAVEPGKPAVTALGEPFIFGIPDENRDRFIARQGLRMISDVGSNELRRRYLPAGFVDPAAASPSYLCIAEVPERR